MDIKEKNQTKLLIIKAFWELLELKEYHDITISQIVNKAGLGRRTFYRHFKSKDEMIDYTIKLLMKDVANIVLKNDATTLEMVIKSYFEFWDSNIDVIDLLNKAHLLYFVEDNLLSLMYNVAIDIGHVPNPLSDDTLAELYETHKFAFSIKLGGLWKATILWSGENPRKTPEQMSKLIADILN